MATYDLIERLLKRKSIMWLLCKARINEKEGRI